MACFPRVKADHFVCLENSQTQWVLRVPGIAERQLGILNLSVFPDAELALGDPREAFRATVSTFLHLENLTGLGPRGPA